MKKSDKTRLTILEAAQELFKTRDVSHVSVEAITKKAGVGKGTFYLYFDSKTDMVDALIRDVVEQPTEMMDHFSNTPSKISSIEKMVDEICSDLSKYVKTLELIHKVQFLRFLAKHFSISEYNNKWTKSLEKWITRGVNDGEFAKINPQFASEFIALGAHGVLDNLISSGELSKTGKIEDFGAQLKIIIRNILKP